MIIIGIDPGTIVTGYGIIHSLHNELSVLDYGCIRPPKQVKLPDRYLILFNGVEELLNRHATESSVVVVETQYVKNNVQTAIKLGGAKAAAIIAARKQGIPVVELAPTRAKAALVGRGHASKQQVQYMVKARLGLPRLPEPADAADALALAVCYAQSWQARSQAIVEV